MNLPKIEDIKRREDGSLLLWSQDWLNNIVDSYIENLTEEEWYSICESANKNGVKASYILINVTEDIAINRNTND